MSKADTDVYLKWIGGSRCAPWAERLSPLAKIAARYDELLGDSVHKRDAMRRLLQAKDALQRAFEESLDDIEREWGTEEDLETFGRVNIDCHPHEITEKFADPYDSMELFGVEEAAMDEAFPTEFSPFCDLDNRQGSLDVGGFDLDIGGAVPGVGCRLPSIGRTTHGTAISPEDLLRARMASFDSPGPPGPPTPPQSALPGQDEDGWFPASALHPDGLTGLALGGMVIHMGSPTGPILEPVEPKMMAPPDVVAADEEGGKGYTSMAPPQVRSTGIAIRVRATGEMHSPMKDEGYVGPDDIEGVLFEIACWFDWYFSKLTPERIAGATALDLVAVTRTPSTDGEVPLISGWMYPYDEKDTIGIARQCFSEFYPASSWMPHDAMPVEWFADPSKAAIPVTIDLLAEHSIRLWDSKVRTHQLIRS